MEGRSLPLAELTYDNPILVKHARARLRRSTILGAASIVGALGLLPARDPATGPGTPRQRQGPPPL